MDENGVGTRGPPTIPSPRKGGLADASATRPFVLVLLVSRALTNRIAFCKEVEAGLVVRGDRVGQSPTRRPCVPLPELRTLFPGDVPTPVRANTSIHVQVSPCCSLN